MTGRRRHRTVVAGGSIAGLTAVQTLLAEGYDGDIVLLSDEDVPPYTRVPLSKEVLAGAAPVDQVVLGIDDGVDLRLNSGATSLDVDARVVRTETDTVPFDDLVIATGARARRIGRPDQRELVVRSHHDCRRLSERLTGATSVLIVGGGFLGMEIASTCAAQGLQVTVVDLAPPLDRLLGRRVAAHVRTVAETAGVRFVISPGGVRLLGAPEPHGIEDAAGHRLSADVVVSAVGDVPNVEWLAGCGLPVEKGVVTDEWCRVRPHIVACGDVAVRAVGDGTLVRNPTWTNAIEQGRAAALTLLSGDAAAPHQPSRYFWTEQFGLDLKMVGDLDPQGEPEVLDGDLATGQALLTWPSSAAPGTVVALNHHTPPAKLKRMLRHVSPAPA